VQVSEARPALYRFGNFDLDTKNGELRKGGILVKLPPQPLGVLALLVENAGELVTREQIQKQAWGEQTFVDIDRNLNVCMTQIRSALNDDAETPRFIKTVPKRGYMFLAPVERVGLPLAPVAPPAARRSRWPWVVGLVVVACAIASYFVLTRSDRVMIAVLPFEGDAGDGLTEELIGNLGTVHAARLGVIARSSVMRFKGSTRPVNEVARDLRVEYVVEGTVRESGGRVRVTARLVKAADQALVWTETYEEDAADAFRMEQEAAARITAGVTQRLFPQAKTAGEAFRAIDREAYEAYRTGRSLQYQGTRAGVERSIAQFEEATRRDPRFAAAYAAIADAYVSMARAGGSARDNFQHAAEAGAKAVALDDSSAEGHTALGNVRFWSDWNWNEAEQHFKRALAINPSYAPAHHDYAWFLVAMGRTEQGLTSLRTAIALDPLSVRVNIDAGWLLQQAHRYDQAIAQARRAQELDPGLEEAKSCIERARHYQGTAKAAIARPAGDNPYALAVHLASVGDKAGAIESLEKAVERRSIMMPLLKVDPAFTTLHGESRFQQLVARVGIP